MYRLRGVEMCAGGVFWGQGWILTNTAGLQAVSSAIWGAVSRNTVEQLAAASGQACAGNLPVSLHSVELMLAFSIGNGT